MNIPSHFPSEPQKIWGYFHAINQIPRPSKREDKFREFILQEASSLDLKTHTDEVKKLLSDLNKKPKNQETRNKISESLKKYHDLAPKPKNTRKIKIDDKVYLGYNEASKELNIPVGTIRNRLKSESFENYSYID
jgi:dipeptidase D